MAEEVKHYMQPHTINVEEIRKSMLLDSEQRSLKDRFGFFSIIHANTIGDQAYSQKRKIERNEQGKVKINVAPRGIYAKATKKGKFMDSYFDANFLKEDNEIRARMEQISEIEKKEALDKVKRSKEKVGGNFSFKPAGLQELKDIFRPDKKLYDVPIYKPSEKLKSIDFKARKVATEPRGIFSQPLKQGSPASKGVLFSYQKLSDQEVERFKSMTEEEIKNDIAYRKALHDKSKDKANFAKAFVPNSVNKCDVFQPNKSLYAIEESRLKEMIDDHKRKLEYEANRNRSYAKHDKNFKPASLTKKV